MYWRGHNFIIEPECGTCTYDYLYVQGSTAVSSEYSKSSQPRADPSRADEIVVNTFMTVFVYLFGESNLVRTCACCVRLSCMDAAFIRSYLCVCVCVHACVRACVSVYIHMCMHAYVCADTCALS